MKTLSDCKNEIHSCSKCGLCQSVCPIYKVTGNDCTVSRGQFIMLRGFLKGELKMTGKINRYLDLCLKCGACSKFCPSGIDVVDIVALAKSEYFKTHKIEKFISWFQKNFVFGFGVKLASKFAPKTVSKSFDKKVIFYSGCGKARPSGNISVIKILNSLGIEVLTPDFGCCGTPYFVRGDMESFKERMDSFFEKLDEVGVKEVLTICASCEKSLKSYSKWSGRDDYTVKNIFEYIRENELKLSLKSNQKVSFHKPCHIENYEDVKWILDNTENLEYVEAEDFDKCCGLNGISKLSEYGIMLKLFNEKRAKLSKTGAKTVLTSCLGCEAALKLFSLGKYKVCDFTDFLGENLKNQPSS